MLGYTIRTDRFIELSTTDSVYGREMVHYDVLLDDLHLYSGTVSHKLETLPPWNLQHDWPHGVNIVTANSSFGTIYARITIDTLWVYGAIRGTTLFVLPGNVGDETSGYGVGGREYR